MSMQPEKKNSISVRTTTIDDIPLIMELVKALAEFEGLADHVLAAEESLKEGLFGRKKYAEAIVAEIDEEAAGFIVFFHNFSTFVGKPGLYIEDIFVYPEHRGKGVGKALMSHCGKIARERNCGRIEWSVLDWNPARKFYEHMGGEHQKEWLMYRLDEKGIEEIAGKK
ncbi:GNAT family N-acetyltransferase [Methanolobus bombayensis]|uniref:GNAT family N-acetyltransferase n=1 Tax=Methanolobus bombayensis TaxID=38023 RepID=UPI001FD7A1C0|nr:GNAT family N-acetyltransferase [Methanolobus bombayensis]MBP1908985.1 GNAT superfamily N-acetyltransferase [Methanolobus bombayensis]